MPDNPNNDDVCGTSHCHPGMNCSMQFAINTKELSTKHAVKTFENTKIENM
jgi:hypothetical protein